MQTRPQKTLTWTDVLAMLKACAGDSVLIRDGRSAEPVTSVGTRPSAKGTELCLFSGKEPKSRADLVEQLETFAKSGGRRFMTSARTRINDVHLLIDGVGDESIDGVTFTVLRTRRPTLGFNQSQQTGAQTTLRTKRIKTG